MTIASHAFRLVVAGVVESLELGRWPLSDQELISIVYLVPPPFGRSRSFLVREKRLTVYTDKYNTCLCVRHITHRQVRP